MTTTDAAKRKEYNRRYYENGGQAKVQARNKINKAAKLQYVRDLKATGSCTDCGGKFSPVAMDYDHTGTDKVAPVSQLCADNASYERINLEISKCDLVCSNCHRVRSHERLTHSSRTNGGAPGS